ASEICPRSSAPDRWRRAGCAVLSGWRPARTRPNRWSYPRHPCRRKTQPVDRSARSATRQAADRRVLDAHAAVPPMKLLEEVGIDLEQIERGGVGQGGGFHEAEQEEEIVQL